jgi:hypothetical protein
MSKTEKQAETKWEALITEAVVFGNGDASDAKHYFMSKSMVEFPEAEEDEIFDALDAIVDRSANL